MYSKERAQQVTKNDVKFIPAGIQENVALKSARVAESPTGRKFFEVTFEKDGATLVQTEWKPDNKNDELSDEAVQKKEDNQFSRIMQLLLCFYKDEQLVFNGTKFEEFSKEVVDYLNNADKSKLLRVKVVYNDKGYTTLPSYAKYTFVEPMVLPEGQTSAITELRIDNFAKPIVADVETPVASIGSTMSSITPTMEAAVTNTTEANPYGLPF
jgi:hypothetical protein|nr:MAG TPA: hypothetical protein [Caudoviricetes sp.]